MGLIQDVIATGATGLVIGGEPQPASDGATIDVLDPATGSAIAGVSSGSTEDAIRAVDAADAAAEMWAASTPRARSDVLQRAFEIMIDRQDELAELIVLEMGKALPEAAGEIAYAAEFFRWYSGEAVRNIGRLYDAPAGDKRIIAIQQPVGVSLLVTPWNFPSAMATRKIGPAIAAGCTMVLKPASDTPLSALAIARIMEEAGLPRGVLNVLPSRRSSEVGAAMLADPRVRKLSFTGSTEVGRILLRQAADQIINCSMELGGNSPFIVFEDADVEAAVTGAMIAKMRNGGQSCVAANRFIVHAAIADDFSAAFSAAMAAVHTGPGMEPGVELGPMINRQAQEDLHHLVDLATGAGASVEIGGAPLPRPGFFFPPTVLKGVGAHDPILEHEIFGPIAPIITFESEEEAIAIANDTHHGLAAYLYSGELARSLRVAEALESGMVGVNRGIMSDPAAPFGGVKQSGLGREGAHDGMLEFQETKYIAADW